MIDYKAEAERIFDPRKNYMSIVGGFGKQLQLDIAAALESAEKRGVEKTESTTKVYEDWVWRLAAKCGWVERQDKSQGPFAFIEAEVATLRAAGELLADTLARAIGHLEDGKAQPDGRIESLRDGLAAWRELTEGKA